MKWVPNGPSVIQTDWGENGKVTYPLCEFSTEFHSCVSIPGYDGRSLLTVNSNFFSVTSVSEMIYFNLEDGSREEVLDLSKWWIDANDSEAADRCAVVLQNCCPPLILLVHIFICSTTDPVCSRSSIHTVKVISMTKPCG